MFKISRTRVLDKVIAEVEKMDDSVEKFKVLMFLDEIQHNENMIRMDKELENWFKGFGTAILASCAGIAIGAILSKYSK